MTNNFVNTIPVRTAVVQLGFKPREEVYLPQAHNDTSEELIKNLILKVDKLAEFR